MPSVLNIMNKTYRMSQLRKLITANLGVYGATSNKDISNEIKSRTGYEGGVIDVMIRFAEELIKQGLKVKEAPASTKRRIRSKELKGVGQRFSSKNIATQTTPAVKAVMDQLDLLGIQYIREYPVVVKKNQVKGQMKLYIVDLYLPPPIKCIIELDGNHHFTREGLINDKERDLLIAKKELGQIFRIENKVALRPGFDIVKVIKTGKRSAQRISTFINEKKRQDRLSKRSSE